MWKSRLSLNGKMLYISGTHQLLRKKVGKDIFETSVYTALIMEVLKNHNRLEESHYFPIPIPSKVLTNTPERKKP